MIRFLLVSTLLVTIVRPTIADEPPADFMNAIRQELARLNVNASCNDANGSCRYKEPENNGRSFEVGINYSKQTDTIYIFIDPIVILSDPQGPSLELSRAALELNAQMTTAKIEWNKAANTIRLSTVLNTDSNFDRRAFRSQIKGIIEVAKKIAHELERLQSKHE